MRWLLLVVTVILFYLAFGSRSPGWMALGLFAALVMCFVTVLAFAARRIEARAQREHYTPSAEEIALLKRREARAAERKGDRLD